MSKSDQSSSRSKQQSQSGSQSGQQQGGGLDSRHPKGSGSSSSGSQSRSGSSSRDSELPNPIEVQKFLGGIDYPCDKSTLLEHARSEGADDRVMQILEDLPDREFDSPTAISREVGKMH